MKVLINGEERYLKEGESLVSIAAECKNLTVAAMVNNELEDLNFNPSEGDNIELIELSSEVGVKIYRRSLFILLAKAAKELFKDKKLSIRHSISRGTYCELSENLLEEEIKALEEKMQEYVERKIPLKKSILSKDEALKVLKEVNQTENIKLLETLEHERVTIYRMENDDYHIYRCLVPHTGFLSVFELMYAPPGFLLRYPDVYSQNTIPPYEDNKKLFSVLVEYKKWIEILDIPNVSSLNRWIIEDRAEEVISVSEALHDKKLSNIADIITRKSKQVKIVLISGPSSSGKTTFASKLGTHLKVNGIKPVNISLDNYFLDREKTPLDENGKPDFEILEAIDIELFDEQLKGLIEGKEVQVPIFDFHEGRRSDKTTNMKLEKDQIIIIEGIHGLNDRLTPSISNRNKFKIYISALTQLTLDYYGPISTTDTRLLRRLVRDYKYRSSSAERTFSIWSSVRRGEFRNIFPFSVNADIMFNSALVYELSVLKNQALELLNSVPSNSIYYSEACRLKEFLSYFRPIAEEKTPNNSIIREFIGGSILKY